MTETVTIKLPDSLALKAKEIASFSQKQLEDLLVECIDRAINELPVESLPDEQVLALCDLEMDKQKQQLLNDLLSRNRDGQINDSQIGQLDELMQIYRQGMVNKARAWKVAIERGLKSSINQ
jgi:hypothetical protein